MIQKCCAVCLPTLFQGANLETHKSFHWKSIQSCVFSLYLYLRNLAIHSFKVSDRITLPQGSRLWNWRLASFVSTNPPDIRKHQEAHTFPDANLRNTVQHRTWQTQNVICLWKNEASCRSVSCAGCNATGIAGIISVRLPPSAWCCRRSLPAALGILDISRFATEKLHWPHNSRKKSSVKNGGEAAASRQFLMHPRAPVWWSGYHTLDVSSVAVAPPQIAPPSSVSICNPFSTNSRSQTVSLGVSAQRTRGKPLGVSWNSQPSRMVPVLPNCKSKGQVAQCVKLPPYFKQNKELVWQSVLAHCCWKQNQERVFEKTDQHSQIFSNILEIPKHQSTTADWTCKTDYSCRSSRSGWSSCQLSV